VKQQTEPPENKVKNSTEIVYPAYTDETILFNMRSLRAAEAGSHILLRLVVGH